MHELTLVQGIVDAINESAEHEGKKVRSCRVGIGELAQFDAGLLKKLFHDLAKGTSLEGAKLTFIPERSAIRCLGCGAVLTFRDLSGQLSAREREMVHFLPELLNSCAKCPSCSKSYFQIEAGRSVRLAEVTYYA